MATQKFMIALGNNMSKEEEINLLDRMQYLFNINPDNYLASLFSPAFVAWAKSQIRQDGSLDAMDYIDGYHAAVGKGSQVVAEYEDKLKRAEIANHDKLAETEGQLQDANFQLGALRLRYHELETICNDNNRHYKAEVEDFIEKLNQKYAEVEAKDNEIVRLKAKLYDIGGTK